MNVLIVTKSYSATLTQAMVRTKYSALMVITRCQIHYDHYKTSNTQWSLQDAKYAMVITRCQICNGHYKMPNTQWSLQDAKYTMVITRCQIHNGHYKMPNTAFPCFDAYLKLTPTLKRRLLKRRQIGRLTPTLY